MMKALSNDTVVQNVNIERLGRSATLASLASMAISQSVRFLPENGRQQGACTQNTDCRAVLYIDASGYFYFEGEWHHSDITTAAASATLASLASMAISQSVCFPRGKMADNKVQEPKIQKM